MTNREFEHYVHTNYVPKYSFLFEDGGLKLANIHNNDNFKHLEFIADCNFCCINTSKAIIKFYATISDVFNIAHELSNYRVFNLNDYNGTTFDYKNPIRYEAMADWSDKPYYPIDTFNDIFFNNAVIIQFPNKYKVLFFESSCRLNTFIGNPESNKNYILADFELTPEEYSGIPNITRHFQITSDDFKSKILKTILGKMPYVQELTCGRAVVGVN